MRQAMMIELEKCVGCKACVVACKERWDSGPTAVRDWVHEFESGSRETGLSLTFYPGLCNQCSDHPCTSECPTGATYATEGGVVTVDPNICIGCGNCVSMCPYGARHPDPVKGIVEKCNFCAPYVAKGEQPACVTTCLASCRHFGDLDDPKSEISQLIKRTGAKPLVTETVNVRPNVYYAPEEHRQRILASGKAVKEPRHSTLTEVWQNYTRPLARVGVPALAIATAAGGAIVNFRNRTAGEAAHAPNGPVEEIPRHRLGMRVLHWFNALSWVFLIITGTALMATPAFALFGQSLPAFVNGLFGGTASLLKIHVLWGLLWAAIIVPAFLAFKEGGIEALREVRLTADDIRWLFVKPLSLWWPDRFPLPPQDKYNAGQKLFAVSALAGTSLIIGSGLVMTFHIGPSTWVATAIMVHKLAIALALVGVSVHITMAAIVKEERPALQSMLKGTIRKDFAEHHSPKWVNEIEHHGKEKKHK